MVFNSVELNYDFNKIYKSITKANWKRLNNSNLLLTGCTGPFGFWLLNSLIFCEKKIKINLKIYVLTRKKNSNFIKYFRKKKFIKFITGDIRNFKIPKIKFDYIIHGATTSAKETFLGQNPFEKYSVIADGTRHLLKILKKNKIKKFLFLSSGSVYNNSIKKISENFLDAHLTSDQNLDKVVLGEAKRSAEVLISSYAKIKNIKFNIARCFTFAGPYMPLDVHYAFGNFIKRVCQNKSIVINGHPHTKRSYLSFADLTIALWKILFDGKNREIYNVGSDRSVSILELAKLIKKISKNKKKIIIKKINKKTQANVYLPNIKKLKNDLKFSISKSLKKLIKDTLSDVSINKNFYFKNEKSYFTN